MMDGAAEVTYRTHLFTVSDFLRMEGAGVFASDARVELIEGEIIDMAPIGSRHAGTINDLNLRLIEALGRSAVVAVQNPLVLGERTQLQPDFTVLRPRADVYRDSNPRPSDVLLVIEVADTSLALDRDRKLPAYARAGIPELWIIDVGSPTVHVFRDPQGERYGSELVLTAPESIGIAAFPDIAVDLSGFFPQ